MDQWDLWFSVRVKVNYQGPPQRKRYKETYRDHWGFSSYLDILAHIWTFLWANLSNRESALLLTCHSRLLLLGIIGAE